MTRLHQRTTAKSRPSLSRPVVALIAIFALLSSGFVPWAQAVAASSGAGALLAAICSPNGVRYVEIDLGVADREPPPTPLLGALDHCPGCLGGGSALLPVTMSLVPPLDGHHLAPWSRDHFTGARTVTRFRPRAPPPAS